MNFLSYFKNKSKRQNEKPLLIINYGPKHPFPQKDFVYNYNFFNILRKQKFPDFFKYFQILEFIMNNLFIIIIIRSR